MARTFADEVVETSSTTGNGTYSLDGAKGDYRRFRAAYGTGETSVYYGVRNAGNTKWELNRNATLTHGSPDTLTRSVFLSTNGNAAVDWVAADLPLTLYVPSAADVLEGVVTGFINTARHALLRAGASWLDSTLGLATAWKEKLYLGGSSEALKGVAYIAEAIFASSQRVQFVDKGAANYSFTADDVGKCLCFDTTAAVRILTMLANNAAGMGHGAYVFVKPYGSSSNGVTFTPGGADTTDLATAPPGRMTKFQWDGAKSKWIADYVVPTAAVRYVGQCRLTKSGGNLLLSRFDGSQLTINGVDQTIPSAGVTLAATSLTPDTNYNIYAFMSAGTMTLEASTTAHAADSATGIRIKSGDATRTLVGKARVITGPAWVDTDAQRFVISHFNRRPIAAGNALAADRTTTSASYVEIGSSERAEFLTWDDDAVLLTGTGRFASSGAQAVDLSIGIDDTTAEDVWTGHEHGGSYSNNPMPFSMTHLTALAEGYHYAILLGRISGGATLTVDGSGSAGTRTTIKARVMG